MKGHAPKIDPTLTFFDAVQAKRVAIFFVTGRRDSQRRITIRNLRHAGFKNWTGLRTRPDDDHSKSIIPFKSGERVKIEKEGYSIIASIGDQLSDFDGGHAECGFKLPNPFYFVP
jgi:predicted secreted acid phosphatase